MWKQAAGIHVAHGMVEPQSAARIREPHTAW